MGCVELGDIANIKTGKLDANASSMTGKYLFFTCSNKPLKIDSYSYDCECVLVAGNGNLNVKYYNGKFDAYQRTYIIESIDKNNYSNKYLYYLLENNINNLRQLSIGGVIKYIKLNNLTDILLKKITLDNQKKITKQLDSITELIEIKEKQYFQFCEMIHSQFTELFGDLRINEKRWNMIEFKNFVEYMADIGSNGSNENVAKNLVMLDSKDYALMVRTMNFTANDFSDKVKYISKKTYDYFNKSQVYGGEIIMNKIGSPGECWIMPNLHKPVSLGLNQFLIRLNNKANTEFIYYLLNSCYGKQELKKRINGAVTKSIGKLVVKEIPIPEVPLELQNEFANFVTKTEEQKELINKEIEKLQYLFDTKMNEYFG